MLKRLIGVLLTACVLAGCMACAGAEMEKRTTYFFDAFDTIITIMGYTEDQETFDKVAEQARQRFLELHKLYDAYNEYEGVQNIYTINRDGAKGPVKVAPELMNMLLFARKWQPVTGGAMNVALGSVLQIWHEYRQAGIDHPESAALPPMGDLEEADKHTNFDDVVLSEADSTVFFSDPKVQLDVGGLAKGYATELVAREMLASEMPHFIINAGGNVRVGLKPLDGRERWGVSLQNPDAALDLTVKEQTAETLYLNDTSVVTSGDYQRFYVVDGVRYPHIVDPATLMPADRFRAVTVVCQDSGLADLLSTAVFILPYEEGRALVESIEGAEALWIQTDGTIQMTDGLYKQSKSGGAAAK